MSHIKLTKEDISFIYDNYSDYILTVLRELDDSYFPNTSGNVSVLIDYKGSKYVLATPSSIYSLKPKNRLNKDELSLIDLENRLIYGLKQTSEINLHLAIYKNIDNVNFVIHTHPFYCTVFAVLNKRIETKIMAESYLKVSKVIYVPYETPSTLNLANKVVKKIKREGNFPVILFNHGLVVFGNDVNKLIDITKTLEHTAKVYFYSLLLSNPKKISNNKIRELEKLFS
ncbi:MAG: class II aldolase/adducin family protein [bacterium]|jgi:L-fuculose-phosphate aldolase